MLKSDIIWPEHRRYKSRTEWGTNRLLLPIVYVTQRILTLCLILFFIGNKRTRKMGLLYSFIMGAKCGSLSMIF